MFLEWENNSGKLQIISGEFQNNAINDVKQISLNHVIKTFPNICDGVFREISNWLEAPSQMFEKVLNTPLVAFTLEWKWSQ